MSHNTAAGPPATGYPASLVSNRVSLQGCGGQGGEFFLRSEATGRYVAMPCQRNRCGTCGPRKAVATAIAAGMAGPVQLVTLTLVGEEWPVIRRRLSSLRSDLRGRGFPGEYWGAVERNPKGTGHHVHLWRRGGFLPQRLLSERAQAWGMGRIVDVRRYQGGAKGVVYGVKTVGGGSSYGLKAGLEDGGLDGFLDLHGGRYGVWSRGFFGVPYRDAVRAALTRSDRDGHDPGPWHVVNVAKMYQDRFREKRLQSVGGGD